MQVSRTGPLAFLDTSTTLKNKKCKGRGGGGGGQLLEQIQREFNFYGSVYEAVPSVRGSQACKKKISWQLKPWVPPSQS